MTDHTTPQAVPLKRCTICQQWFPADAGYFVRDRSKADGFRPQCKPCSHQRQKEQRDADPERFAAYSRSAYLKNPKATIERIRLWRQTPKGKLSRKRDDDRSRERRREEINARNRKRYLLQKTHHKEKSFRWRQQNPDKVKVIKQRRHSRKMNVSANFTSTDWKFAVNHFEAQCAVCGRPAGLFHTIAMDHWIPLTSQDCPGTIPANIVPLCHGDSGCNNSKRNHPAEEWLVGKFGKKQADTILARVHDFFSQVRQV